MLALSMSFAPCHAGRKITRSRDEPATAMKAALACSSG